MNHHRKNLLIIDDDTLFGDSVASFFHSAMFQVNCAYTGEQGLAWCRQHRVDVVLLDQKLPDCDGIDLCEKILAFNEQTKIIFITAFPSFEHAVNALRNGAHDYLSKPMEFEELKLAVDLAFRTVHLEQVEQVQQFYNTQDSRQNKLLGMHGGLSSIREHIKRAADNRSPILITGETGTGKTVVAKAIHYLGENEQRPFIDTNCASLPENLIESELFGHEKGAFTGAAGRRKGLFEMADGGTLFLDEIGEMPLHLQSKLLGALDNGMFRRVGGQTEFRADVRVIAATNVDLEEAIIQGNFRKDLYYRISVMRLKLPPLRERQVDIPELAHHFLHTIWPDKKLTIDPEEITSLQNYSWPGNVRELKNVIERAIILRNGPRILPSQLIEKQNPRLEIQQTLPTISEPEKLLPLAEMEKQYILQTLTYCNNNRTQAAKVLGIARSTLIRKLENYTMLVA